MAGGVIGVVAQCRDNHSYKFLQAIEEQTHRCWDYGECRNDDSYCLYMHMRSGCACNLCHDPNLDNLEVRNQHIVAR